jgi:hypothetical protein
MAGNDGHVRGAPSGDLFMEIQCLFALPYYFFCY